MRILVVEDEKEIADGIIKILENANYKVDCAYDGIEGLYNILSGIEKCWEMNFLWQSVND